MKKGARARRFLLQTLLPVCIVCGVVIVLNIIFYGVPLQDVPKVEDVERVTIKDVEEDAAVELTDPEEIELACKLLNFMKYAPFSSADDSAPAKLTATYILKDGREQVAMANDCTGWWNGKPYTLKEEAVFVNIARGLYFSGHGGEVVKTHG